MSQKKRSLRILVGLRGGRSKGGKNPKGAEIHKVPASKGVSFIDRSKLLRGESRPSGTMSLLEFTLSSR